MYKSYFIIGWRSLLKSKTHSFINISGLAVGIASCLMISLYINDELSYDRFHANAERIQRIVTTNLATVPGAVAPELLATYPHMVEQAVRLWPLFSPAKMRYEETVFVETGVLFADPTIFSVFTWRLVAGNPAKALLLPNSIVLTQSMASKYFGTKDPTGAQMEFWGTDLTVTGVMVDVPHNSHLQFDFLISFSTLHSVMGDQLDQNRDMPVFYTYVLPRIGVDLGQLESSVDHLFRSKYRDIKGSVLVQSLPSIHLHSHLDGELKAGGNIAYLYVLGTAALFILLLASINFTNLNTARATTRSKEVGMRKVLGARKGQLVEQFFAEAVITSAAALLIAVALVTLMMPAFNEFAGKAIQLSEALTREYIAGASLLMLLIGFCSGSYPALFLSRLKPVNSLKSSGGPRASSRIVRKGLIVFQFIVSTFFLTSMVVVLLQLDYLQSKDLGFDAEQIIVLDGDGFQRIQGELQSVAGVEQVSGVPQVLPALLPMSRFRAEGLVTGPESQITRYGVTPAFIETMGMEMVAGRSFLGNSEKDEQEAFILNEAAVLNFGWDPQTAVGKPFSMSVPHKNGTSEVWLEGYIIGIVEDFHHEPLYKKVKPMVLYSSYDLNLTLVRVHPDGEVISSIQKVWDQVNPDSPFNYYFLDDRISRQYESESKLGALMTAASGLAVLIACLGLLGLVSFSANQRTKEIGIRKVMGASSAQIIGLLSTEFIKMVALSAVLSLPFAYYSLNTWLSNFAYHIRLSWVIFFAAGLLTLLVAILTVILQSWRAAMAQPTESLRSE